MKKNLFSILLLCLFLFVSCNLMSRQPVQLIRADSLMQTAPDSALTLLEEFSDSSSLKNPSTRAWYALLLTQARDKNYVLHTNDSLMRIAVDYYDSKGSVAFRAKAHYYLGRVYQDMKDDPKAVREFMTALPLVEKAKDYQTLCILQNNLGYIYYLQEMYEQADSLCSLAEQLALQQSDSTRLAAVLSLLGNIRLERGPAFYASTENRLRRALSIAESEKNVYIEKPAVSSLSILYDHMENSVEAIRFAKRGIALQGNKSIYYRYYLILGKAFDRMNQCDSAIIYLTKSLPADKFAIKTAAYKSLSDIARKQNRLADALRLMDSCRIYSDSATQTGRKIEVITSLKDVLIQQTGYQYNTFLYRYRYYMYSLGVSLLSLTIYFIYKRVRYNSLINTLKTSEAEKERLKQLYICQNAVLEQKRELCAEMEVRRIQLESEVQLLTQHINNVSQEDAVSLKKQMAHLMNEREKLFRELIKVLPIYKQLQDVMKANKANPDAKEKLSEMCWKELKTEIDRISGNFTVRLNREYELFTESDIRFCCLLKIGLKYSELALLYGCEPNAMYKRRDTILNKAPLLPEETKLEELIRAF